MTSGTMTKRQRQEQARRQRAVVEAQRRRQARVRRWAGWGLAAAAVAVVALLLVITARSEQAPQAAGGGQGQGQGPAPAFALPATDGSTVSLASLRGRRALLYFNEGVGCDGCWYQMVELERQAAGLRERGLTVVPIVANGPEETRAEMARFKLRTPYLLDLDKQASAAYGVLGTGHHADLPGHSFVLIDEQGRIRWKRNYSTMFVPPADLFRDLQPALAQR